MNISKIYKALYAGGSAGVAAFVPLAAGATKWSIIADVGTAVAVGIATGLVTYRAPANKGSLLDGKS